MPGAIDYTPRRFRRPLVAPPRWRPARRSPDRCRDGPPIRRHPL